MKKYTDFDIRMKEYEYVTRTHLMRRTPVIIRIDGKAFHTFTKGFDRPFDRVFMNSMQDAMKYLCENIQGCVLGYTQSDEITLVLVDYQNLDSCAWFDYNIQKITSVSASMATVAFVKEFQYNASHFVDSMIERALSDREKDWQLTEAYIEAVHKFPSFDSRAFNIPKEEVTNCILWRQNDATRNSILSFGQSLFSHSELNGKSCKQIQDMAFTQKGENWNDLPDDCKRGSCCVKMKGEPHSHWVIDRHIPIFKGDGREYIESRINFNE